MEVFSSQGNDTLTVISETNPTTFEVVRNDDGRLFGG